MRQRTAGQKVTTGYTRMFVSLLRQVKHKAFQLLKCYQLDLVITSHFSLTKDLQSTYHMGRKIRDLHIITAKLRIQTPSVNQREDQEDVITVTHKQTGILFN